MGITYIRLYRKPFTDAETVQHLARFPIKSTDIEIENLFTK